MSEKNPTPFIDYYFSIMSPVEKNECIQRTGLSRAAFYAKKKSPGKFSTDQSAAICDYINEKFGHKWNIEAVRWTVIGNQVKSRKPEIAEYVH